MDLSLHQLKTTLKNNRRSLTHPRYVVFEVLQAGEPLTMPQLIARCGDKIDKASIYRNVALFEDLGIIQRLQIGWKYKLELSDAFQQHHHHLTCLRCGTSLSLTADAQLENRLRLLAASLRFKMQGHQLEIQGLCHACQANSS